MVNGLRFNTFMVDLIQKSYNIEKFGEAPFQKNITEQKIEVEPEKPITEPKTTEIKEPEKPNADNTNNNIVDAKTEAVETVKTEEAGKVEEKPKKTRKITRLN